MEECGWLKQAEEELELLEAQEPNKLINLLKDDLKSFIFFHQSQTNIINISTSSTATTQVSRSSPRMRKKKKKVECWEDRVEAVVERAKACLCKISHFKETSHF